MHDEAATLIASLGLLPHPEGGYYRETWRAAGQIPETALPNGFAHGDRAFATAIYFLLQADDFSALHRIASDELWFFHAGDPLEIVSLSPDGNSMEFKHLGLTGDASPFQVIPASHLFGARVRAGGSFALVSCVVAPGFDFRDFVMPSRGQLLQTFPHFKDTIMAFTRAEAPAPEAS